MFEHAAGKDKNYLGCLPPSSQVFIYFTYRGHGLKVVQEPAYRFCSWMSFFYSWSNWEKQWWEKHEWEFSWTLKQDIIKVKYKKAWGWLGMALSMTKVYSPLKTLDQLVCRDFSFRLCHWNETRTRPRVFSFRFTHPTPFFSVTASVLVPEGESLCAALCQLGVVEHPDAHFTSVSRNKE